MVLSRILSKSKLFKAVLNALQEQKHKVNDLYTNLTKLQKNTISKEEFKELKERINRLENVLINSQNTIGSTIGSKSNDSKQNNTFDHKILSKIKKGKSNLTIPKILNLKDQGYNTKEIERKITKEFDISPASFYRHLKKSKRYHNTITINKNDSKKR